MARSTFKSYRSLLFASLAAVISAEELRHCGESRYYPSQYTCYADVVLCPILFGQPTIPCNGACYSPEMYECVSASLELLPEAQAPFVMTAQSSHPPLDGQEVKACGDYLHLGKAASTCVYCYNAPPLYDCSSYGNRTALMPNGEMAASVPGGQYWYIDPEDGALRFTAGGKANSYGMQWAGVDVTVYEDGYFSWDEELHYWLACPVLGQSGLYRIYAATEENLNRPDCHEVKLATDSVARSEGAYMYD